jgi:ComF family protein
MNLKKFKNIILNFIFPIYCPDCNKFISSDKNIFICEKCFQKIVINSNIYCPFCFKKHFTNKYFSEKNDFLIENCEFCYKKCSLDLIGFATNYKNPVIRKLIHGYKYRFAKKISLTLSKIVIQYLENFSFLNGNWILISIPLHKKRKNWRGFNQSYEIAKIIGKEFNIPVLNDVLIRVKNTKPQAEIKNSKQRKENLKKAFDIKNRELIENKNLILIDDVYSSGSTLISASKLLKENKSKNIIGITIAR